MSPYTRFFVTVSPLMGVITLYGLNFVLSRYPHKPKKFINTLVISSAVFMLAISDWGQTSDDYSSFMKMDNFYREYVAKHGRPGKVFCEYNYFDFLHDIETNADWRPKFNKQQLEKAEPGSLVLWVYPYERKKTDIEPDYFFSKQTIARGKELSQGKQNYLHLIHTARPPWRELADFSAEESLDDESPFIQKVFIKE